MLKTIKTTKHLKLHELIKYAWENDIRNKSYRSDNDQFVKFRENGRFISAWELGSDVLFTVEVEEEITGDTIFDTLVSTYIPLGGGDIFIDVYSNHSIKDIIETDKMHGVETERIYALIDDKLELIWEREE